MRTLRQVRDELVREILPIMESDIYPHDVKIQKIEELLLQTAIFIHTCTDEEFEVLGQDIPTYEGAK